MLPTCTVGRFIIRFWIVIHHLTIFPTRKEGKIYNRLHTKTTTMRSTYLVVSVLSAVFAGTSNAFTAPSSASKAFSTVSVMPSPSSSRLFFQPSDEDVTTSTAITSTNDDELATNMDIPSAMTAAVALWTMTSTAAEAAGPDWGIFEGRTGSLLHPIVMGSLLLFSVSTALLGFDWRRQRTIGDEINELKKSIPDLNGASSVSAAIEEATKAEPVDSAYVAKLQASLSTDAQIKELQAERKELAAKGARDKHYAQGSLLAFVGTLFAIEVRAIKRCFSW